MLDMQIALLLMKMFFSNEIPLGLPPIQAIGHQINLIHVTNLANRAAYRTNLNNKTKEILC
jgi:hypothetical protein